MAATGRQGVPGFSNSRTNAIFSGTVHCRKVADALIPFNVPVRFGDEAERLGAFVASGRQQAGGGPVGQQCEALLSRLFGRPTLLTTSGTHALEMAALLLELQPGDEVIIPAYTFVSTANAFVLRGARPVFADVDLSGNLQPAEVSRLRGPRTRAVCVVHYAGNACDMAALAEAANGLPIIEDAAQAIAARQGDRPLGSFGIAAAVSFHDTKNSGCGEGGALVIGDEFAERATVIREKGTNRKQFQLGLVDKYTWVDVGSSYVLSEINAMLLLGQLERLEEVQRRRAAICAAYTEGLDHILSRTGVRTIKSPAPGNNHLFALVFPEAEARTRFITAMRRNGVVTPFHYVALHLSEMGRRFHKGASLPNAETLTYCLVRLPVFFNLKDDEVATVVETTSRVLSEL